MCIGIRAVCQRFLAHKFLTSMAALFRGLAVVRFSQKPLGCVSPTGSSHRPLSVHSLGAPLIYDLFPKQNIEFQV